MLTAIARSWLPDGVDKMVLWRQPSKEPQVDNQLELKRPYVRRSRCERRPLQGLEADGRMHHTVTPGSGQWRSCNQEEPCSKAGFWASDENFDSSFVHESSQLSRQEQTRAMAVRNASASPHHVRMPLNSSSDQRTSHGDEEDVRALCALRGRQSEKGP